MAPLIKLAWGLASASIIGLGGWVYSTSQRVAVAESQIQAQYQQLKEMHDDIRDLRNHLLGAKP